MRLSRLRRMQGLPMRRWLRGMRRLWWMRRLRRWLGRHWLTIRLMCRLLRILGPVPLVLGGDAF
jgi:hypothetical protein